MRLPLNVCAQEEQQSAISSVLLSSEIFFLHFLTDEKTDNPKETDKRQLVWLAFYVLGAANNDISRHPAVDVNLQMFTA